MHKKFVHLVYKMANTNTMVYLLALLQISLSIVLIQSAPESSLVTQLPGLNETFQSKHYAGYVTVDQNRGRNLYYYFVTSESHPSKDPVVLWLEGGPGCSSLDSFVYAHGPFTFEKAEIRGNLPKLHLNPYSWSKVSNIIYLDSPAGTGFSYSKNESDYRTGDLKTGNDLYTFLLEWFKLYPEFLSNSLFIGGDTYAGVNVAILANQIVLGFKAGAKPKLNFKGYLIGNGATDETLDANGIVPFAHGMGLISDEIYEDVKSQCNGNYHGTNFTANCTTMIAKVKSSIADLNQHNILERCRHIPQEANLTSDKPMNNGNIPTWGQLSYSNVPCIDDEVATVWLNMDDVRKAIHAVDKNEVSKWEYCTTNVQYNFDAGSSLINYHKNLTSQGYRALIYRYAQVYEKNLTFLTVKGSGYAVAQHKPKESLYFYQRFLDGLPLTESNADKKDESNR
ncbi:unnamed protein product [Lupinus luteus]|uniref:Uncharacterized protein n=1 Tax=Lupinus luteus TaxID=3873 RepID=A0AAV1W6E7_LUPLU